VKVIAIDGPAGSGKSTIARAVADRLGLEYLDTGAMYRAATWAVLDEGGDPADEEAAVSATLARPIRLGGELGVGRVRVGTVDVTQAIRGPEVSAAVSVVSAHPGVRAILRERQRDWVLGRGGGVVEGRDIGTVVFPDARLKVFLTARPEVRARRRADEVGATDEATIAEWAGNIAERDRIDSGRADSPLVEADDSWLLDTSDLSIAEVVERIVERAG